MYLWLHKVLLFKTGDLKLQGHKKVVCHIAKIWYDLKYFFNSEILIRLNPLSANPTKWSNKLKQLVGNLPT